MKIPHSIYKLKLSSNSRVCLEIPNSCPHCGQIMIPSVAAESSLVYNQYHEKVISILCQCLFCDEFFALTFKVGNKFDRVNSTDLFASTIVPYTYSVFVEYDLPEEMEEFSPAFREIYRQAQKAEAYQLNHVAGIGYRKSLEFLVKDFLINVRRQSHESVDTIPLSQAIHMLENEKLISLAKAATWIGNDETHFVKKYEDKDIEDMKKYIRALSHYLSSEYLAVESSDFISGN